MQKVSLISMLRVKKKKNPRARKHYFSIEKDQLPSSLMDRFLLRINEWIEELRMKGLWSILYYLSSTIDQVIQYSIFVGVGLGRCS